MSKNETKSSWGLINNYVTPRGWVVLRDSSISVVVLHVFRDSEHDAGGWVVQN